MQSAVSAVVGMFVVSQGGAGLVTERDAVNCCQFVYILSVLLLVTANRSKGNRP